MAVEKWNEAGRTWEVDYGWLDEEQIAKCARADEGDTLRSPVPTQMVSNGEYMPALQTNRQKKVEARIKEPAESASSGLGPRYHAKAKALSAGLSVSLGLVHATCSRVC